MFATFAPATLAQVPQTASGDPRYGWLPVLLLLIIGIGFAIGNIVLSLIIGPSRTGPGKEATYESGMTPIGDTRKRFNVRFYVVAMIFLVFDVDIIFFYPLCSIFPQTAIANHRLAGLLLVDIIVFVLVLLVAYLYAWGKGVFRWD
ncbi:MAG TPA: NADH-quinone oxidoreductase subunit A [Tepidisphaeraceae bacterium]|nr:NADH-quinone oxidoreductase subunit A [Tepidisphaeraceae bacterium]